MTARKKTDLELRRGWTSGTCASAAAKAAAQALLCGKFPDSVEVTLPRGQKQSFTIAMGEAGEGYARAGVIKDAGDDPDVTHGAMIIATLRRGKSGDGIRFFAGKGVGTVTKPGLAIPPGQPAINPVPRDMICRAISEIQNFDTENCSDFDVEISIPRGEELAKRTLNARLGILGGLSILGTTGIVRPFSCAAWIASIHRGIDVARAAGLTHIAGATGSTSEKRVKAYHQLSNTALLEMGDFIGGTLKYLRKHPLPRLTIAGGFAKLTKFAQGAMDLHSGRSRVDFHRLAVDLEKWGAPPELCSHALAVTSAAALLEQSGKYDIDLAQFIAREAQIRAGQILRESSIASDIMIIDRNGKILAMTEPV